LLFIFPTEFQKRIFEILLEKQKNAFMAVFIIYRGPERIRTAVGAFAELSLATRPQDLFILKQFSGFQFENFSKNKLFFGYAGTQYSN